MDVHPDGGRTLSNGIVTVFRAAGNWRQLFPLQAMRHIPPRINVRRSETENRKPAENHARADAEGRFSTELHRSQKSRLTAPVAMAFRTYDTPDRRMESRADRE